MLIDHSITFDFEALVSVKPIFSSSNYKNIFKCQLLEDQAPITMLT